MKTSLNCLKKPGQKNDGRSSLNFCHSSMAVLTHVYRYHNLALSLANQNLTCGSS